MSSASRRPDVAWRAAFGWASAAAAQAGGGDYHARFEELCGRCHGHSGPFARETLEIVEDRLVGRATGRPVEAFLRRHPGGLSSADSRMFHDVMYRQVQSGGVYRQRCAICHGRAVEMAARDLAIIDGHLVVRYGGRSVRELLGEHGRLEPDEIDIVHQALSEIVGTR